MKSISKLKKELDKWFSLFIRLRDANEYGMVQCFTCNVQPQSPADNLFGQGEQYKFGLNLDAKYGEGTAEELELKSHLTLKMTRVDYEDKISYYKDLVKNLKKEKGIE